MIRKALGAAVLMLMVSLLGAPGSSLESPTAPNALPEVPPVTVASPPWSETPATGALAASNEDSRRIGLAVAVIGTTLLVVTLVALTRRPAEVVIVPAELSVQDGRPLAEASAPRRDLHEVRR